MTITTTAYLEQSVRTVFKNKDDLADAQACLSESGIPAIISCLDVACSCSFSALANLRNDPPPQAVAISIGDAITASGGETPDDIYLKKKVGNEDLTTSAKDLSAAVNELDNENGILTSLVTTDKSSLVDALNEVSNRVDVVSGVAAGGGGDTDAYIPIGTLGSFYECSSLTDTSPTLIATGANTIAGMSRAEHKCHIWSFSKLIVSTHSPNSAEHPDYSDTIVFGNGAETSAGLGVQQPAVFASFSNDGGCFSIDENSESYYSTALAADANLICLYALDH